MKKEYIQPAMSVVVLKNKCQILAGSNRSLNTNMDEEDLTIGNEGYSGYGR